MRAVKDILLFVVGFMLAILAFPLTWGVSALLGYASAIAAIVIGAYLVARRSLLPLILGVILLVIAVPVLLGTIAIHLGLWAVEEAVEEITRETTVTGSIGEAVKAGEWAFTVLGVREAEYLKKGDSYYKAKEGYKLVLVRLRIENIGKEVMRTPSIWELVLVTDARKSYEQAYTFNLEYIPSWELTEDARRKAIPYEELDLLFGAPVAPGTAVEGDVLFQVPAGEKPERLHFKVGVLGGYQVTINLRS